MIVVAIIGLLAAIGIPNFVHARQVSQTNVCINNLREIDNAKQQWALEQGRKTDATPVDTDIKPYLGRGDGQVDNVRCPLAAPGPLSGYTLNEIGTPPKCDQADDALHPAVLE